MSEENRARETGKLKQFWSAWWGLLVGGFILLAMLLVPLVLAWIGLLKTGFGEIRTTIYGTAQRNTFGTGWTSF